MPGKVYLALLEVAHDQLGYITTNDVENLGLDKRRLQDYEDRGHVERVARGVYRFNEVPHAENEEYMVAVLSLQGKGIISHESALLLHDLCGVNPNHIDITLPPEYRSRKKAPPLYRIHKRRLLENDVSFLNAIPVVSPMRAILDAIEIGVRDTLVDEAIKTAQARALITKAQLFHIEQMREVIKLNR